MAMPAARRWLDPMTGDYVVERGSPRADDTNASNILLRLRMRRGSMPLLPTFGSRLHLITRNAQSALRLAEHYAYEAIEDLVRDGSIRGVVVKAESLSKNGGAFLAVTVSFSDSAADARTVQYERRLGA